MLKCITLTGADDSISPGKLFDISKEFPFVEWGVLFSKKQMGNARFPSPDWMDVLGTDYHLLSEKKAPANFSLHLCGEYVRLFLKGNDLFARDLGADLFEIFKRVQINTHCENHEWDLLAISSMIKFYPETEFIFQIDGNPQNMAMAKLLVFDYNVSNVAFLLDASHGAGILPDRWDIPPIAEVSTGYAGGFGADNLEASFEFIKRAVELRSDFAADYWLDMETKIRDISGGKEVFSLEKCLEVLKIADIWFPKTFPESQTTNSVLPNHIK